MQHSRKVADDAIRAVIFVFILFAVAEIIAPFFHVKIEDPFLITGFVLSILRFVIKPKPTPKVILLRDSEWDNFVESLPEDQAVKIITCDSANEALEAMKKENPELAGVKVKIKKLLKLDRP